MSGRWEVQIWVAGWVEGGVSETVLSSILCVTFFPQVLCSLEVYCTAEELL